MQWLIQCTSLPDDNSLKLLEAVKSRNLPFVGIGVIPFTNEIIGLDQANPALPTMFWGSTKLIQNVSTYKYLTEESKIFTKWNPGVIHKKEWFDPRFWVGKRSDLLNEDVQEITVEQLRANWVAEPTFVKSVDPKVLTGMVIEQVKEDKENWLIEQSQLEKDELLIISSAKNIETECRFFIINGEIITGSTYRWLGVRSIRRPIEQDMISYAQRAVKEWMPNQTIVIDLCKMKNGEFKVVEFNAVNSSGFYNCDVGKIVDRIELL